MFTLPSSPISFKLEETGVVFDVNRRVSKKSGFWLKITPLSANISRNRESSSQAEKYSWRWVGKPRLEGSISCTDDFGYLDRFRASPLNSAERGVIFSWRSIVFKTVNMIGRHGCGKSTEEVKAGAARGAGAMGLTPAVLFRGFGRARF